MKRVNSEKVRWGIVSTAQIGRWVFAPALRDTARGELVGVASRDRARAAAFAGDLDIPEVFASYDDLLWSDRVDAVYLPLPNSLHEEWAVRAMEHGKHVFCEKPLATGPEAAQRMVDAAGRHGVVLMEAMVYRYHPQTAAPAPPARRPVRSATCATSTCAWAGPQPPGDIRLQRGTGRRCADRRRLLPGRRGALGSRNRAGPGHRRLAGGWRGRRGPPGSGSSWAFPEPWWPPCSAHSTP